MFIGACGFGSTGSSVITDYLKEFDDVRVKDDLEFTWVSRTDGLIDLERAVMHPHNRTGDSITAIRRFKVLAEKLERVYALHGLPREEFRRLIDEYLESITTVKWYWYSNSGKSVYTPKGLASYLMRRKIIPKAEIKRGHHVTWWPLREVSLSVKPENFYEASRKLVQEMLTAMGVDTSKTVALDQPFAGNNPQACFPFFDNPYAVVVDRDPRDNYVFARTKLLGKFHYIPINSVEDYIAYYRALRKDQPYLEPNPRILNIRFEDMVYEYKKTSAKVREFLHLPENPRPRTVFEPNLSIANTQVFKRFPQFAEDVRKIERELPEYLFDFSKYPEPDFSKKMFYGKSPLHEGFKRLKQDM